MIEAQAQPSSGRSIENELPEQLMMMMKHANQMSHDDADTSNGENSRRNISFDFTRDYKYQEDEPQQPANPVSSRCNNTSLEMNKPSHTLSDIIEEASEVVEEHRIKDLRISERATYEQSDTGGFRSSYKDDSVKDQLSYSCIKSIKQLVSDNIDLNMSVRYDKEIKQSHKNISQYVNSINLRLNMIALEKVKHKEALQKKINTAKKSIPAVVTRPQERGVQCVKATKFKPSASSNNIKYLHNLIDKKASTIDIQKKSTKPSKLSLPKDRAHQSMDMNNNLFRDGYRSVKNIERISTINLTAKKPPAFRKETG